MLKIQKFTCANNLEEAYASLMKNPKNLILGGMIWLKMEDRIVPEAIDISKLGLDQIEETEDEFCIGSMVTLRQLEINDRFNACTSSVFQKAVKDIVGVQLRNMATIGGSLFSRFGFSDVLCALMALDTKVHLYHAGTMTLQEFASSNIQRDILTHITVSKNGGNASFHCLRKSATDISVLNVCVSRKDDIYRICVGARPAVAKRFDIPVANLEVVTKQVLEQLVFGSNMRASSAYREHLAKVLIERALREVE